MPAVSSEPLAQAQLVQGRVSVGLSGLMVFGPLPPLPSSFTMSGFTRAAPMTGQSVATSVASTSVCRSFSCFLGSCCSDRSPQPS